MIKINIDLFYYLLFGLAIVYLAVGIWSARSVRTLKNYFLANQNLGVIQLTFAIVASQLGSGMILGTAYQAYFIGFWGLLYTIGICCGFIILGCGVAARMRSLNIATTAEIFQTHYHSTRLRMFASCLSIISMWGILVAQMVASKALFSGLQISDPYIFLSCWLFIITYSMLGGLHSIVMVDMVQLLFIIATFVVSCKILIPAKLSFYLTPEKLAYVQHRLFNTDISLYSVLPTLCIPILFSLISQDVGQKFFAAKSKATATVSAFLTALLLIILSCVPLYFGILARLKSVNVSRGNPFVLVLAKICPEWMFIVIICAILAAIMSTASSLLCAINSNIIQDFTSHLHFERMKLWFTKSIALVVGLSAVITSLFASGDILYILEQSYRLSVVCLFVPIFIAYISKPRSSLPAWISVCFGLLSYNILNFTAMDTTTKDLSALGCSLLGFILGYIIALYQKKE